MAADVEGAVGGRREPRAWVVLSATLLAAVVVVAGIVGYRAWRDSDENADGSADAVPSTPPTTEPAAPDLPTRLLTRTTADGIELRVDRTSVGGFLGGDVGDVPEFCQIVDEISTVAITPAAIVQNYAPLTAAAPDTLAPTMASGPTGLVSLFVQVPDDVVRVRLTTPNGLDEMEPVEGVAVLAVDGPVEDGAQNVEGASDPTNAAPAFPPGGPQPLDDVVLTSITADGQTMRASGDQLAMGPPAWGDPACFGGEGEIDEPATTLDPDSPDNPFAVRLPPAGSEQPPDPAEAQRAVGEALAQLYGATDPDVDPLTLVDDPFAVREVLAEAQQANEFRGEIWNDAIAELEELVFLSPVEAAFEYTLEMTSVTHHEQFGRARFIDGTWRVGRSTLCRDLALYGVTCPP